MESERVGERKKKWKWHTSLCHHRPPFLSLSLVLFLVSSWSVLEWMVGIVVLCCIFLTRMEECQRTNERANVHRTPCTNQGSNVVRCTALQCAVKKGVNISLDAIEWYGQMSRRVAIPHHSFAYSSRMDSADELIDGAAIFFDISVEVVHGMF